MISHFQAWARLLALVGLILAAAVDTPGAQAFPLLGAWTLNPVKSTLGEVPQSQTIGFRAEGPQIIGHEDTVYADGSRTSIEYAANVDGRDYPLTGSPEILVRANTVSMLQVDGSTIVWTYKKDGAVTLTLPGTLSRDGRTLTMTAAGGQVVLVYERQ
jgi:hypothetical protein